MTDTLNRAVYMDEHGAPIFLGRVYEEPTKQRGRGASFNTQRQFSLKLSDYHHTFDNEGYLTSTYTTVSFKVVDILPHLWVYEPADRETEILMGIIRDNPDREHIKHLVGQMK